MHSLAARQIGVVTVFVAALCFLAFGAETALAQGAAEAFVREDTGKALAILKDKSLSEADRHARMGELMTSFLDLKRMAIFTLGRAAGTASLADIDAFVAAYRGFALASYSAELGGYMGQTLRITGSAQRSPGDTIVNAVVLNPTDRSDPPAPMSFRVLDEGGGKFALVDASIAGVWFTLAQRDDFAGFLSQNGGEVSKLTAHLKDLATK
jgi:phospholipid transport system substrate-binding protein